ncbi:MAG: cation diffusion facilitator family transporter [Gemmatimonadota bacterium]|nr:cation diffusion facilitator family transporter [Gemmatimonadota bacterium]
MSSEQLDPESDAANVRQAIRAAQAGAASNLVLAFAKIAAGVFGHTYALVADGIESLADVVSSLIVWGGVALGAQPADEDHPYGHGKAESLAAAGVSAILLLAAFGIVVQAVQEIRQPHRFPAAWTLGVLLVVVILKSLLAKRVKQVGKKSGSAAVEADAAHHLSDAITSTAAFIGISAALLGRKLGGGPRWAAADDWAALVAAIVISRNGVAMFLAAFHDLMDRTPGEGVLTPLRTAALSVPGVRAIEQLAARRVGVGYRVTVHVQADPDTTLQDAHALGGRVKYAMCRAGFRIQSVLVHMEPYHAYSNDLIQPPSTAMDAPVV